MHPLPTATWPSPPYILHHAGIFVKTDEPTLAHQYPPELDSISVSFWCCISLGFGQIYSDIYLSLYYCTE